MISGCVIVTRLLRLGYQTDPQIINAVAQTQRISLPMEPRQPHTGIHRFSNQYASLSVLVLSLSEQVILTNFDAKPLLTTANILISSYFLKNFLIVMEHITECRDEVDTFLDVNSFHRKKHTCLGFELMVCQVKKKSELVVHNHININVLQLDPANKLVGTAR